MSKEGEDLSVSEQAGQAENAEQEEATTSLHLSMGLDYLKAAVLPYRKSANHRMPTSAAAQAIVDRQLQKISELCPLAFPPAYEIEDDHGGTYDYISYAQDWMERLQGALRAGSLSTVALDGPSYHLLMQQLRLLHHQRTFMLNELESVHKQIVLLSDDKKMLAEELEQANSDMDAAKTETTKSEQRREVLERELLERQAERIQQDRTTGSYLREKYMAEEIAMAARRECHVLKHRYQQIMTFNANLGALFQANKGELLNLRSAAALSSATEKSLREKILDIELELAIQKSKCAQQIEAIKFYEAQRIEVEESSRMAMEEKEKDLIIHKDKYAQQQEFIKHLEAQREWDEQQDKDKRHDVQNTSVSNNLPCPELYGSPGMLDLPEEPTSGKSLCNEFSVKLRVQNPDILSADEEVQVLRVVKSGEVDVDKITKLEKMIWELQDTNAKLVEKLAAIGDNSQWRP